MEVYVDNMLVKSRMISSHVDDLREAFATLYKYRMKLNRINFAFRVTCGEFLDFMIS